MAHFDDVKALHQKFGLLVGETPGPLTYRKLRERIECLQEELGELEQAVLTKDFAKQADALVDLVVFALGTAVMMGLPWEELWNDVHRANMAKERGVGHRGHAADLVKPPGWVGPQTDTVLINAGYDWRRAQERDDAE